LRLVQRTGALHRLSILPIVLLRLRLFEHGQRYSSNGPCAPPSVLDDVLADVESAASDKQPKQQPPDCTQYDSDVKDCRNDALICIALALGFGPGAPEAGALCLVGELACVCRAQNRYPECGRVRIPACKSVPLGLLP
jgi:hypothetical protein